MEDTGRDFADVLAEAQAKGYAEADPSFDIEGIDAAHKLSILAAIAFGAAIDFAAVDTARHHAHPRRRHRPGRCAGLSSSADRHGRRTDGRRACSSASSRIWCRFDHPLAHVDGATNAVVAEGNFSAGCCSRARGAGDGPTASAVVADLIDIARGDRHRRAVLDAGRRA